MTPSFLQRLRVTNNRRSRERGPRDSLVEEMLFRSNEMGGECGEAQDAVKKYVRFMNGMKGGSDDIEHIGDELADVIICADRLAEMFDLDLEKIIKRKFNMTSEKYGFEEKL